jgi:hypothetical protein
MVLLLQLYSKQYIQRNLSPVIVFHCAQLCIYNIIKKPKYYYCSHTVNFFFKKYFRRAYNALIAVIIILRFCIDRAFVHCFAISYWSRLLFCDFVLIAHSCIVLRFRIDRAFVHCFAISYWSRIRALFCIDRAFACCIVILKININIKLFPLSPFFSITTLSCCATFLSTIYYGHHISFNNNEYIVWRIYKLFLLFLILLFLVLLLFLIIFE